MEFFTENYAPYIKERREYFGRPVSDFQFTQPVKYGGPEIDHLKFKLVR
jgi:hypothetical protein